MRAAFLCLLLLMAPIASASWSVTSTDTGPNQLVIYNDYWHDQRTTRIGDEGTFHISVKSGAEGDYKWHFQDEVSHKNNTGREAYESFRIYQGNTLIGDLVDGETPTFYFERLETKSFRIEYAIAELNDAQLERIKAVARENVEKEGGQYRDNEVHAWATITQVTGRDESTGDYTYNLRNELALALVHRLPAGQLEWLAPESAPQDEADELPGDMKIIYGTTYTLDEPAEATLTVSGALADTYIEFCLDEPETPLQQISDVVGLPKTNAVWFPGTDKILVQLPAGTHTLCYMIPDNQYPAGTVTLTHQGGQFQAEDHIELNAPVSGWIWTAGVLGGLVVVGAAWWAFTAWKAGKFQGGGKKRASEEPEPRRSPEPAKQVPTKDAPEREIIDF